MEPSTEQRLNDLVRVLGDLTRLHEELRATIRRKLDAARAAEVEVIQSCTAREAFLATRLRQRDGLRRQLAERIGGDMGLAAETARSASVSELVREAPEPLRGRVLAAATALRDRAEQVADLNRTAALVTGTMLEHLRAVTTAMTQAGSESSGYSSEGRRAVGAPVRVFDAVG